MKHSGKIPIFNIPGTLFGNISGKFIGNFSQIFRECIIAMFNEYSTNIYLHSGLCGLIKSLKKYLNQMRVDWGIFWYIYIILGFLEFWLTDVFIKHNYFHYYQPLMACFIHILSHNAKMITFCFFSIKSSSCRYYTWLFVYFKVFFFIAILYLVIESKI